MRLTRFVLLPLMMRFSCKREKKLHRRFASHIFRRGKIVFSSVLNYVRRSLASWSFLFPVKNDVNHFRAGCTRVQASIPFYTKPKGIRENVKRNIEKMLLCCINQAKNSAQNNVRNKFTIKGMFSLETSKTSLHAYLPFKMT